MSTQAQIDATKAALQELFEHWDSRANLYREVMYSSVIAKNSEDKWLNAFTYFQPLSRSERRSTSLNYKYAMLRIAQGLLSLEQVKDLLMRVAEEEQLALPNQPQVPIQAYLHKGQSRQFWRSDARLYPVFFPYFEYRFGVEQATKVTPPHTTISATDLPLYPSGRIAIEDLLYTRLGDNRAYEGVLSALVPDFRGRISGIQLSNASVSIRVVCAAEASLANLVGKFFSEDYYGNRTFETLKLNEYGETSVPVTGFPQHLVVALLAKADGELIDERVFDARVPYNSTDVLVDSSEVDIENIVKAGESETTEFKSQLPQKQDSIAITAVAFANQKGGRIFIGVENDGQIIGFAGVNAKDTVSSILRDRCEPPIEWEMQETTVLGKPVFVLTVSEGNRKPYQVKDRGFYIRAGATNRMLTRYEIDEMYSSKSYSPFGSVGL